LGSDEAGLCKKIYFSFDQSHITGRTVLAGLKQAQVHQRSWLQRLINHPVLSHEFILPSRFIASDAFHQALNELTSGGLIRTVACKTYQDAEMELIEAGYLLSPKGEQQLKESGDDASQSLLPRLLKRLNLKRF
jgi:hypothetical protein